MKVLYYSELINYPSGAGIHGRKFLQAAQNLCMIDSQLEIRSYLPITTDWQPMSAGLKRSPVRRSFPTAIELGVLLRSFVRSLRRYKDLLRLHNQESYDVLLMRLQSLDWSGRLATRRLGIPLVLEVNSPIGYEVAQLHGSGWLKLYLLKL